MNVPHYTISLAFHCIRSINIEAKKISILMPLDIKHWLISSKIAATVPLLAVRRPTKCVTVLITVTSKNFTRVTKSFASTPQSSTRRLKETSRRELQRFALSWPCTQSGLPNFDKTDVFVREH